MSFLDVNLKLKIRRVFEPDYKRVLTDEEVITIANNLTDLMEAFIKFKLRQKYENIKK